MRCATSQNIHQKKALQLHKFRGLNYICNPFDFARSQWNKNPGGLAHLARALAWHARGNRFDSGILH